MILLSKMVENKIYFWLKDGNDYFDSDIFGNKYDTLTVPKDVLLNELSTDKNIHYTVDIVGGFRFKESPNISKERGHDT